MKILFIPVMLVLVLIMAKNANQNGGSIEKNVFSDSMEKKIKSGSMSFMMPEHFSSAEKTKRDALNNADSSSYRNVVNTKVVKKLNTRMVKIINSEGEEDISLSNETHDQNYFDTDGNEITNPSDTWETLERLNNGMHFSNRKPSSLKLNQNQVTKTPIPIIFEIETMQDDAEAGETGNWEVYTHSKGDINNILDPENDTNHVIQLEGDKENTGYRKNFAIPDKDNNSIEWKMNFSEPYTVYVSCQTTLGHRFLYYTSADFDDLEANFDYFEPGFDDFEENEYIHHGLNAETEEGQWHTITRDLTEDLQEAQPDNNIISIDAILFRGSGLIDDIKTLTIAENQENGTIAE